jgi:SPP1 gp7 family putative phage head morphogenesis protein
LRRASTLKRLVPGIAQLHHLHRRPQFPVQVEAKFRRRILVLLSPLSAQVRRAMPKLEAWWRQRRDSAPGWREDHKFGSKEEALRKLLDEAGLDIPKDFGAADAAFRRWRETNPKHRGPRPVYTGGELDSVNRELSLEGDKRVSGLLDAFERLTRNVKSWSDPKVAKTIEVLREVPGLETLRLPADVMREQLTAAEKDWFAKIADEAAQGFEEATSARDIAQAVGAAVHDVDRFSRNAVQYSLGVDPFMREPWLHETLAAAANESVVLIKSIPDRYYGALEDQLTDAYKRGLRWEEVQADLTKSFLEDGTESELGIARRRAGLIARDQVGKLGAAVTKRRMEDAGVTKYIWRTALDERVRGNPEGKYPKARPSHWDREGKTYSFDDPPAGGNPGEAILCRCIAEPIIEEVDQRPGFDGPSPEPDQPDAETPTITAPEDDEVPF